MILLQQKDDSLSWVAKKVRDLHSRVPICLSIGQSELLNRQLIIMIPNRFSEALELDTFTEDLKSSHLENLDYISVGYVVPRIPFDKVL